MDLLSFINHLQKKIRSGGATTRVHGIGQGHDTSVSNDIARGPAPGMPTDAASGYMNADMLDGYHAKQVYHGRSPAADDGINADTLDSYHARQEYDNLPVPDGTGINADTLDSFHARQEYDNLPVPDGTGINADTLDSFHGRESYHGVVPATGTGLNADTLDGVHKLYGHSGEVVPDYASLQLLLSTNSDSSTSESKVTVKLYRKGDSTIVATYEATAQISDTADTIGPALATNISAGNYLNASYNLTTNILELTTKGIYSGERHNFYIKVEIIDNNTAPLQITKYGFSFDDFPDLTFDLVPASANPLLGVDADMLDSIHANSGHFVTSSPRNINGKLINQGINADLVDGLHARVPLNRNGNVATTFNGDGTVNTADPYIPVADGGLNPNLVSSVLSGPNITDRPRWELKLGNFNTNQNGYSSGMPELVAVDATQSDENWAWVIRTFDNRTGGADWDTTSWNDANGDERGYLRWVANPNKYKGTVVDIASRALVADSLAGGGSGFSVSNSTTAQRIANMTTIPLDTAIETDALWGAGAQGGSIRVATFSSTGTNGWDSGGYSDIAWNINRPEGWWITGAVAASRNDNDSTVVQITRVEQDTIWTNSNTGSAQGFITVFLLDPAV